MKYIKDEKTGTTYAEPDCCDEWLFSIWALGCDYDGRKTEKDLKELIDELISMSVRARECLRDGRLFSKEG